ncbi:hypothetical protein [Actinoplanes regularis]|uniref:hypothetical protein n=1 Tax=Actinoplanes regularis TaxID=52697 RepID=UPI00255726EE|nr:hypothetical protein [Actinoplanes regularis]
MHGTSDKIRDVTTLLAGAASRPKPRVGQFVASRTHLRGVACVRLRYNRMRG